VPLPLAPRLSLSFFLSLLLSPPLHTSFSIMLARARLFVLDRARSCLFVPIHSLLCTHSVRVCIQSWSFVVLCIVCIVCDRLRSGAASQFTYI
jgi:hypothetical protein